MSVTRVHFRERQRLTQADFWAEQEYRLGLGGRHHLGPHDWGVVRGLQVIAEGGGRFALTSGVAIDGYGREIVVPGRVVLPIKDPDGCWSVLLSYCEDPEQIPPRRSCQDEPAPRITPRADWRPLENFVTPAAAPFDLDRASAAGRIAGARPWPVIVALVGKGCPEQEGEDRKEKEKEKENEKAKKKDPPLVRYGETRYVRHRAALIRSPTGRALLQLGLAGRTDVYHFLVSTGDAPAALARRVGIDRDRMTHVWRPLIISGAKAVAQVLLAENLMLEVSTSQVSGPFNRLYGQVKIDRANYELSALFKSVGGFPGGAQPAIEGKLPLLKTRPLYETLLSGTTQPVAFTLINTVKGTPVSAIRPVRRTAAALRQRQQQQLAREQQEQLLKQEQQQKQGQQEQQQQPPPPDDNEAPPPPPPEQVPIEFKPTGGQLVMRGLDRTVETPQTACGDLERYRQGGAEPGTPVVQFRPAVQIEADPLAREIHAVVTSKPTDPVAETELRVVGGAQDESDASTRVSVGGRLPNPPGYVSLLRMDGRGRIEIPRPEAFLNALPLPSDPYPLVKVDDGGTVYLPPIGKKDPLLPDLLAMAFMAGMRQGGRIAPAEDVELKTNKVPASVVRGTTLTHSFTATWGADVQVKRCVELIIGTAGTGDMAFRSLTGITTEDDEFTVDVPAFTHSANKVEIQIQVLVSKNNVSSVAVCRSPSIEVVNP
jgi:hypothetical protein